MASSTSLPPTPLDAEAAGRDVTTESDGESASLERFAGGLFVLAAALGLFVLAAWVEELPSTQPWIGELQPSTGACLILLGSSLRLLLAEQSRLRTLLAIGGILLAQLIAMMSLFETGLDLQYGLSTWVLPGMAWANKAVLRVSAGTGISLSLLALAACFLRARRRAVLMALAALPLLLSLGELVGYVYGMRLSELGTTPVAAPAALGIALLAIGLICTRLLPETAVLLVGTSASSVAVRRLLLGLIAIPLVLGGCELLLQQYAELERELGIALLSVANVLLLLSLSLWYTRALLLSQRRERALAQNLAHKEALLEVDMRVRAERFRAQIALSRSEEKYRTLATHAPVMIFETNADGGCVFVNQKWTDLTERPVEDALSGGWMDAVYEEDRPHLAEIKRHAVPHGQPFSAEYRFRKLGGDTAWVQANAVPLRDTTGALTGYIGTVVDVTERKRTIDALAKSEANFRSLVERAPFGVVVYRAGNIVYANREYLKLFGYDDVSELLGKSLMDTLVHPDSRAWAAERRHAIESGELLPAARVRCVAKDGSEIVVEGASTSIQFDGVPSTVAVARDVTEHERAEQVRILAERALRDSLREKEVLLKEIHHRVKNNLQVIVSLINLQASKIDDEQTRAAFDETRCRVHAIALLHERLYRSKNIGRIEMRDYLNGLASDLSSTNVNRRAIQLRVSAEDLYFEMDTAVPIGLIVNELVTNAFKHAFAGQERPTGQIEVELGRRNTDVLVSVTDDGSGFPQGLDLNRADTLGLLLITSLSRQLGGKVSFERLPKGARAVVRFPDPTLSSRSAAGNE